MVVRKVLFYLLFAWSIVGAMHEPLVGGVMPANQVMQHLYQGVRDNRPEVLRQFFKNDGYFECEVVLDSYDAYGLTLLHWASFWGSVAVVEWILTHDFITVNNRGRNVPVQYEGSEWHTKVDHYEPIHLAAMAGSKSLEELLFYWKLHDIGAEHKPIATHAAYASIIKLLHNAGASPNKKYQSWASPLWIASCTAQSYDVAAALIECGAKFYERDSLTGSYLEDQISDDLGKSLVAKAKECGQKKPNRMCSVQ